jgi:hypothetical protein
MARIELRDCTIRFKDGLSGTGALTDSPPVSTDTDLDIDTLVLNTADTDLVPVGARFTVAGETASDTVHTVTARTPESTSPTTNIVFTPALGAGTYLENGVVTFMPQQIEIKIGDGNITYTEHRAYEYMLDRGDLDTVREGNEVPLDVKLECTYEHITTGTSEVITPMDALKGVGGAAEWVSSSSDQCEPYAIDMEVEHLPPCGVVQKEITLFPDFRAETKEVNFKDATIALTGKCNVVEPTITREDAE